MTDIDIFRLINEYGVSAIIPIIIIALWNARLSIGAFFSQSIRDRVKESARRNEALDKIAQLGLERDDKNNDRIFSLLSGSIVQLTEQLNRLNSVLLAMEFRSAQIEANQDHLVQQITTFHARIEAVLQCKEIERNK